jgi:Zn-dependent protease
MQTTFRLGRVAGVEIGLNWSWFFVFALIVWSLSESAFPDQNPGLGQGTYLAMAVAAAVLFFAALLAHELGHAVQARREGMVIEGITLWLFGGVAKFKGKFPSAGAEFRIAVAGPLVTLVIGVGLVLVGRLAALPATVDGVVSWLGYINIFLLGFNLLPALPLDGGRILRSALWQARGDFPWATRIAADVGRGFGYLFIVAGLGLLIFTGAFGGAWLAFIGWFLLQAVGAEARYVATEQALAGLRVADLMTSPPVTVDPDLTLGMFMDQIAWSARHTTYPVVENGRAVGLLAFRGVAQQPRSEWDSKTVRACMIPGEQVPVLAQGDSAVDALVALAGAPVQRALVLDGERLIGLLSISDLARALEAPPRRRAG